MKFTKYIVVTTLLLFVVGCTPKFKKTEEYKLLKENKDKINSVFYSTYQEDEGMVCHYTMDKNIIKQFYDAVMKIELAEKVDDFEIDNFITYDINFGSDSISLNLANNYIYINDTIYKINNNEDFSTIIPEFECMN